MSIKGELATALATNHKVDIHRARAMIETVLEAARDPNWAYRYHREIRPDEPEATAMSDYWEMLDFLKEYM